MCVCVWEREGVLLLVLKVCFIWQDLSTLHFFLSSLSPLPSQSPTPSTIALCPLLSSPLSISFSPSSLLIPPSLFLSPPSLSSSLPFSAIFIHSLPFSIPSCPYLSLPPVCLLSHQGLLSSGLICCSSTANLIGARLFSSMTWRWVAKSFQLSHSRLTPLGCSSAAPAANHTDSTSRDSKPLNAHCLKVRTSHWHVTLTFQKCHRDGQQKPVLWGSKGLCVCVNLCSNWGSLQ